MSDDRTTAPSTPLPAPSTPLPALAVADADGVRRAVTGIDTTTTVRALADLLGIAGHRSVTIDGRPVSRTVGLARTGIVQGSAVRPGVADDGDLMARRNACPARGERRGHPVDPAARHGAMPRTGTVAVVEFESGPAVGAPVALAAGRHVVGRANGAAVRLLDERAELHHGVLDIDGTGVRFTQLTGRTPCDLGGPADTGHAELRTFALGASRISVRPVAGAATAPATLRDHPADPWRRTLHRAPRHHPRWVPSPVDVPAGEGRSTSPRPAGLLAMVAPMLAGVVVAVVLRNPMYLVLSGVGGLVALATRLVGQASDHRRHHRGSVERRQEVARFVSALEDRRRARAAFERETTPTIGDALEALGLGMPGADGIGGRVWSRRSGHRDAFAVTIGWGERDLDLGVSAESLPPECELALTRAAHHDHVPVAVDLGPGAAIAVAGEHAGAVARSLVVQLATWCGPADWRLVVVADDRAAWAWAEWLPHACVGGALWVLGADGAGDLDDAFTRLADTWTGHLVVVTDRPDLMATRNSPLRRFLDAVASVATLTVVGGVEAVPAACASVLTVGSLCTGRWCPDVGAGTDTSAVDAAGITATIADTAARRLAALHDPEDAAAGGDVPTSVTLAQVLAAAPGALDDAIGLAAHWTRADRDGHPIARLGVGDDGVVAIDLVRDGPHALVAGTTGSGKSELLRTMVASMAADAGPDDVTFVLIDYKGGATFDACRDLPHTVGVVTDLDERLAARAIRSLDAEIRRRERALRDAGAVDLADYRRTTGRDGRPPLPRLVVVIDEFAALAVELPTFLSSLVGVAQRGRSLGIHLVLATQRPAGVVSDDIRANTNIRIALRLNDRHDAIDVVGSAEPAALPRSMPGRAVVRLGPEELVTFQTATSSVAAGRAGGLALVGSAASIGDAAASELVTLARAARAAASLCEVSAPARPWLEPLPPRLTGAEPELAAGVDGGGQPVGVVDDPDHQRRRPLVWRDDAGSLLVVGAAGSGTTSGLASVVVAAAPSSAAIYVVDARGDAALASLGALSTCAGVVGVHEVERRGRVVRRLTDELARRRSGCGGGPLLVAVDGLPSLLSALATHDDAAERDAWVRLIAEGAAVGIRCVATAERPGALSPSMLASFGERWVLHLDDAADAATVGLRPAVVPAALPGRAVVASSGLEAQLAVLDPGSTNGASTVNPIEPIGTLPTLVHPAALSVSCRVDGACELSVGIDFLTLETASLTVPDGEHVVVLGPARSGRSTALVRIAAAWREAHPSGWVVAVAGRAGGPLPVWATTQAGAVVVSTVAEAVALLDRFAADAHGLIVVDDAERVDDHADALATLIARRDPHVLVACAGRPDALRTMYGHWTAVVRRSRLGLLLALGTDADGDLLGEVLPRRTPISPRRGLAWLVDADGRRLVQVAVDPPAGSA